MKVKSMILLLCVATVLTFVFISTSCGDEEEKLDCQKICTKDQECENGTDEEKNKCLDKCNSINSKGYVRTPYIKAMNECSDKACNEIEGCLYKALDTCTPPDHMPFVNAYCDKEISCGSNETKEQCVSSRQEDPLFKVIIETMKCFTTKFFEDYASCISKANCNTLQDDYKKCEDEMGGKID